MTGEAVGNPLEQYDRVLCVAYSPDGRMIAAGLARGTVVILDTIMKVTLINLQGNDDAILSVAFSSDGTRLASESTDKTIRIWDIATGKQIF